MRYHLAPVRMAMIKMSTNNKCWRSYREKETFLHCRLACKLVKSLWRTVWRLLKIELLYDPTIPFLVIYPEKIIIQKYTCNLVSTAAIFTSLQSKGLSRVFSNTTVQKHQFFGAQLSSQSNSHIHT